MTREMMYEGDLNTKRIAAYKKLAEMYNVEEGTVRDIFSSGIEFAVSSLTQPADVQPVVICVDCKSFFYKGVTECHCGCKTFQDTHPSNVPADVQERAKELELFKRLWYNRNPVHENNADSGEDMFWGTAELVAREYAQHLAGASSVSGMQWVKASVLPTEPGRYNIRVMEAGEWQPDTANFTLGRWEVFSDDVDVFEWLDESGASSLQAENERLREALQSIAEYEKKGTEGMVIFLGRVAREALNKQ